MAKRNSGLGRGLDSLFLSSEQQISDASASNIRLSDIDVDPGQPRKTFENQSLEQLSQSIIEHGVLQPIVLMPNGIGRYKIIAGERRFRAARMARLTEIPAIVKDVSTQSAKEIALIENLQREDLDPVEIAYGYKSPAPRFMEISAVPAVRALTHISFVPFGLNKARTTSVSPVTIAYFSAQNIPIIKFPSCFVFGRDYYIGRHIIFLSKSHLKLPILFDKKRLSPS